MPPDPAAVILGIHLALLLVGIARLLRWSMTRRNVPAGGVGEGVELWDGG